MEDEMNYLYHSNQLSLDTMLGLAKKVKTWKRASRRVPTIEPFFRLAMVEVYTANYAGLVEGFEIQVGPSQVGLIDRIRKRYAIRVNKEGAPLGTAYDRKVRDFYIELEKRLEQEEAERKEGKREQRDQFLDAAKKLSDSQ